MVSTETHSESGHLSDRRLQYALESRRALSPRQELHLRGCPRCRGRFTIIALLSRYEEDDSPHGAHAWLDRERLIDWLCGDLEASEADRVAHAVHTCSSCRREAVVVAEGLAAGRVDLIPAGWRLLEERSRRWQVLLSEEEGDSLEDVQGLPVEEDPPALEPWQGRAARDLVLVRELPDNTVTRNVGAELSGSPGTGTGTGTGMEAGTAPAAVTPAGGASSAWTEAPRRERAAAGEGPAARPAPGTPLGRRRRWLAGSGLGALATALLVFVVFRNALLPLPDDRVGSPGAGGPGVSDDGSYPQQNGSPGSMTPGRSMSGSPVSGVAVNAPAPGAGEAGTEKGGITRERLRLYGELKVSDVRGEFVTFGTLDSQERPSLSGPADAVIQLRVSGAGQGHLSLWSITAGGTDRLYEWASYKLSWLGSALVDSQGERLLYASSEPSGAHTFVLVLTAAPPPAADQAGWLRNVMNGKQPVLASASIVWDVQPTRRP